MEEQKPLPVTFLGTGPLFCQSVAPIAGIGCDKLVATCAIIPAQTGFAMVFGDTPLNNADGARSRLMIIRYEVPIVDPVAAARFVAFFAALPAELHHDRWYNALWDLCTGNEPRDSIATSRVKLSLPGQLFMEVERGDIPDFNMIVRNLYRKGVAIDMVALERGVLLGMIQRTSLLEELGVRDPLTLVQEKQRRDLDSAAAESALNAYFAESAKNGVAESALQGKMKAAVKHDCQKDEPVELAVLEKIALYEATLDMCNAFIPNLDKNDIDKLVADITKRAIAKAVDFCLVRFGGAAEVYTSALNDYLGSELKNRKSRLDDVSISRE